MHTLATWGQSPGPTAPASDVIAEPVDVSVSLSMWYTSHACHWPTTKVVMLKTVTGSITSTASPDLFISIMCSQDEPAFTCENYRAPVLDLPILVYSTLLGSSFPVMWHRDYSYWHLFLILSINIIVMHSIALFIYSTEFHFSKKRKKRKQSSILIRVSRFNTWCRRHPSWHGFIFMPLAHVCGRLGLAWGPSLGTQAGTWTYNSRFKGV